MELSAHRRGGCGGGVFCDSTDPQNFWKAQFYVKECVNGRFEDV